MMDEPISEIKLKPFNLDYVGVKAPQFSFTRLGGADPTLSVEMASTGEVGCIGDDFEEAFLKAMLSVGFKLPVQGILLSTGETKKKAEFLPALKDLSTRGVALYGTIGTAKFYQDHGIEIESVAWPMSADQDGAKNFVQNNAVDLIHSGKVNLVINIPKNFQKEELTNGYYVRRAAADFGVPLITNLQLAKRFAESIAHKQVSDLAIKPWCSYQTTSQF